MTLLLTDIEAALIDRVKDALPQYLARSYPDNPAAFTMIHPKGAVLVRFAGSTYGNSRDLGAIVQERVTQWEITAVSKNLSIHTGLYAMIDGLRIALTGFHIPGCDKALPVKEDFVNVEDGLWQYVFVLSIKTLNVQLEEEKALPLLRRLTLEDNFDEITEIP